MQTIGPRLNRHLELRPRVASVPRRRRRCAGVPQDDEGRGTSAGRQGFSLVELLVVIGIIALLIAMLLPSLRKARRAAESVKCAAQLYQLGQGLFNYTARYGGSFPAWSGWHVAGNPLTNGDEPGLGWTEQLEPLFAKADGAIYNCPSFPEEIPMNYFLGGARWSESRGRYSIKASEVRLSTQFVLSGDCTAVTLYPIPYGSATIPSVDCDKDDADEDCLRYAGVGGGVRIHPAGLNVLFGDGHVATFDRFDPASITYHPSQLRSWNDAAN